MARSMIKSGSSQALRSAPSGLRSAPEGAPLSSLEWFQKADRREAF